MHMSNCLCVGNVMSFSGMKTAFQTLVQALTAVLLDFALLPKIAC